MKAEERHRLKTNELAQKLSELPEYLRKHSKTISIGIVAVVVICVVGGFWWSARKKSYSRRNEELQGLFPQIVKIQYDVAKAAQDPKAQSEASSYNISSLLGTLNNLSSEAQGTPMGMMALLQQADLKRSELYYTHRLLSDQEKEQICKASEKLYDQILNQYGDNAQAVGMANIGLALVAEDRGDWDKARKTYEEILAEKDGKLAGTTFPLLAQRRLRMIDEIAISIEFPDIEPEPEPVKPEVTATDKEKVDPAKGITPINFELPEAPVPQVKTTEKPIGPVQEEVETVKTPGEPAQPAPGSTEEKAAENKEKKEN